MRSTIFMRPHLGGAIVALTGALALAGCGSAISDTQALNGEARPAPYSGQITVASEPAGARCVIVNTASGSQVAEITTPAQVALPRSTDIVEARCSAAGRMDTVLAIRPVRDFAAGIHHPQPIGTGIAQNAIVVRNGATRRYNDVTVHLPPQPFASAEARDAWFAGRADETRQAAAPGIARAERAANATIDTVETLRGYLQADLARLDAQKATATVEVLTAEADPAPARRRR